MLAVVSCRPPCDGPALLSDQPVDRSVKNYFSNIAGMPVGAYYYPEHWQVSQWERDLQRMASLGFTFTHFAEFAWARIEPEEGRYEFGWLDTAVALAGKYGLKVVMCTPSPCPPAWLTTKYPEVLITNAKGIVQRHGTRLHANGMNKTYREMVTHVVTKMAARYGQNPVVWGWQIDNEPHLSTLYDYSETSQKRFRQWLTKKYGTIDSLNKCWGAAFWSMTYSCFSEIRIPNAEEGGGNPHALLDFNRFTADEIASFIRYQSNILKQFISPNQFITTNYAYYKFLPTVNLFLNRPDLDFASHTMYLTNTFLNYPDGDLACRLGSGMELAFSTDMARSVCGVTGIMELQPGQINWGAYNAQPLPGAVRMWIWHTWGLGDKFVCTYRYRQPLYGGEQFHNGIMETDGITVSRGGKEYVKAIAELKTISAFCDPSASVPGSYKSRTTAFLWNQDNLWDITIQPHSNRFDPWQHYYTYYQKLKTMGCKVDFITEQDSFDVNRYPVMVAPSYSLVNERVIGKWKKYVENGGHLILSCRSGQKDINGHLWEAPLQYPVWELIGAKILYNDQLPSSLNGKVSMDNEQYTWSVWSEILEPLSGAEVWASYNDQFYSGAPAVVHRRMGKGSVTYAGVWSVTHDLEEQILRKVFIRAGAQILELPDYVFTDWRDGLWITVNYSSDPVQAPLSPVSKVILGNPLVQPGDVCVWKD